MIKRKISNNVIAEEKKVNVINFNSKYIESNDLETGHPIEYKHTNYYLNPSDPFSKKIQVVLGESTNQLFGLITDNSFLVHSNVYNVNKIFKKLNFDPNDVLDSKGNNILHYAAFAWDLKLINSILNKF